MAGNRGIVIKIEGDGASAERALQMVQTHLHDTADTAKHEAGEIASAMERVKGALELAGAYEALELIKDGLRELLFGSLELGEAMVKASQKTGLTVETLSTLHYATSVLGGDFDGLSGAIGKMDVTIGKAAAGNKEAAGVMKALGLNAKELSQQSDGAEVAFHKFVQTLAATESPMQRNLLAQQLLGKAGKEQVPILIEVAEHWDEFKQKAEAAGVELNGKTAEALANTQHQLNDLKQHLIGAGLEMTQGMIPAIDQMMAVIRDGQTDREVFLEWGHALARVLAGVGAAFYGAASGAESFMGALDMDVEASQRQMDAADRYAEKAAKLRDIAMGYTPTNAPAKPVAEHPESGHVPGYVPPSQAETKPHSDNALATARAAYQEEIARAAEETIRRQNDEHMAELETQHKAEIVTDTEFYDEKLRLLNEKLDAKIALEVEKQKTLNALLQKQLKDPLIKDKGKDGESAASQGTRKKILQSQEEVDALNSEKGVNSSRHTGEIDTSARAAEIASLREAAELEKERNNSISARIALIRREAEEQAKASTAHGGNDIDAANIRAAGEARVQKLQANQIEEQIGRSLADNKLKTEGKTDAEQKGLISKRQASAEISELNRQEAAEIQNLVLQYGVLADEVGDPAMIEKAKQMQAEINKLRTPDNKEGAAMFKTFTSGMTSMVTSLSEKAAEGKESFHQMTQDILKDLEQLAIRMAAEKFLMPALSGAFGGGDGGGGGFFASLFGASAEHHASGGLSSGGPQVLGEDGPELWTPPERGGTVTPTNQLKSLAEGGGRAGGISVTSQIVNNSRQPVQASSPQVSYDQQMKQFVIQTVLEDHAQGGPMSALSAG